MYVIGQPDVNPKGLYEAGWRTDQVEGALYELIPPEGRQSTS